jgi:hypothetical protein
METMAPVEMNTASLARASISNVRDYSQARNVHDVFLVLASNAMASSPTGRDGLRVASAASSRAARSPRAHAVAACIAVAVLGALAPACVDPRADYEDFIQRTNDARGRGFVSDASAIEASAIDGGFTGSYYAACLPELVAGNVTRALRFVATVTYVPTDPSSKRGTIDLQFVPLLKDATEMSQTVGPSFGTTAPAAVDDAGNFVADMGAPTVPAAANPISTNDAVFSNANFRGLLLGHDLFCADLFGQVVSPSIIDFTGGNYCLFYFHTPEKTTLEPLSADLFHCP